MAQKNQRAYTRAGAAGSSGALARLDEQAEAAFAQLNARYRAATRQYDALLAQEQRLASARATTAAQATQTEQRLAAMQQQRSRVAGQLGAMHTGSGAGYAAQLAATRSLAQLQTQAMRTAQALGQLSAAAGGQGSARPRGSSGGSNALPGGAATQWAQGLEAALKAAAALGGQHAALLADMAQVAGRFGAFQAELTKAAETGEWNRAALAQQGAALVMSAADAVMAQRSRQLAEALEAERAAGRERLALARDTAQGEQAELDRQRRLGLVTEEQYLVQRTAIQRRLEAAQQQQADREKLLKIQAAEEEKNLATFKAILSTAVSVARALEAGPVLGPIMAGVMAALGAVQVALIRSQPLPRFAQGGLVAGGTPGQDSVHALLMPGERVMRVAETRDYAPVLHAIHTRALPPALLNGWVAGLGQPQVPATTALPAALPADLAALLRTVAAQRAPAAPALHFHADARGFATYLRHELGTVQYLDHRYSA